MKARPILFSGPMVCALLDGRKAQTRRVVKKPPSKWQAVGWGDQSQSAISPPLHWCPYGQPGDLLWVRETWAHYQTVNYVRRVDGRAFSEVSDGLAAYRADGHDTIDDLRDHIRLMCGCDLEAIEVNGDRWRPSIHMPRWASRLTLELTEVRVERLLEISDADKVAEGGTPDKPFGTIWQAINTKPGIRWEDNPWVWALSFRVHQQNVDAILRARGQS